MRLRQFGVTTITFSLIVAGISCAAPTTIYESDCNETTVDRLSQEVERVVATRVSQFPTSVEMLTSIQAYQDFRMFIRRLDIPEVEAEQQAVLTALEEYIVAMNKYLESGGSDLTLNEYAIPLGDSLEDFLFALVAECGI